MNFERERKGYNRAEVDEYVRTLKSEYEARLTEQKNRIFLLQRELGEKEKAIENYRAKSELVSQAVIKAVEKANEIEKLAAARYGEEMDALRAFHAKWTAHYNKLLKKYPDDEGLRATERFNAAMDDILSGGRAFVSEIEEQFNAETKRLEQASEKQNAEDGADKTAVKGGGKPAEKAAAKKRGAAVADGDGRSASGSLRQNSKSASGFDFNEAWNPTDDLAGIMKDLGLGD